MEAYINKKDKHAVMAVPLDAKMQDGYIVINNGVVEWKEKKEFEDLYEEEPDYSEKVMDKYLARLLDSLYITNKNINNKEEYSSIQTPTDEEIKQSEKELNEDLKKHDKYVGFYWPDSMSNEEIEKQLGVIHSNKPYPVKVTPATTGYEVTYDNGSTKFVPGALLEKQCTPKDTAPQEVKDMLEYATRINYGKV